MAEEKTLETYLEQIRKINEDLTEEGIRMDDALNLYREGVQLVKEAEDLLHGYEKEIAEIETSPPSRQ